jgi:hypothetical protein
MKKPQLLISSILIFILFTGYIVSAETIAPGFTWIVGNVTYGVSKTLSFNNWTLGPTWLRLNGIDLNFTCVNASWFNFSSFNAHPRSTSSGEVVFNFTTNTTNRNCTFNISGLKTTHTYMLLNGTALEAITSGSGKLQWRHNLTSDHVFTLFDWAFTPPIITEEPINGTTDVIKHNMMNVTAVDPGLRITVRFYENTTGAWKLQQINQSILSGAIARWTYTNASSFAKRYWWKVVTNNSATPNGWTNVTYYFTTRASLPVVITSPIPVNGSTGISSLTDIITIAINSPDGDTFNWTINAGALGINTSTGNTNGTKTCNITGLVNGTTYYWTVNAINTGSGLWMNATYHFTTESVSLSYTTNYLLKIILPLMIILAILSVLILMLVTGGMSVEHLITWLVIFIIGIIVITIII